MFPDESNLQVCRFRPGLSLWEILGELDPHMKNRYLKQWTIVDMNRESFTIVVVS